MEGGGGVKVAATTIYAGYKCKVIDVNDQLSCLNTAVGL